MMSNNDNIKSPELAGLSERNPLNDSRDIRNMPTFKLDSSELELPKPDVDFRASKLNDMAAGAESRKTDKGMGGDLKREAAAHQDSVPSHDADSYDDEGDEDEDDEDRTELMLTRPSRSARNAEKAEMKESQESPTATRKGVAEASTKYSPRDKLPVGFMLKNRYQIDGILGTGGFGVVYSAIDHGNGDTIVAVKTLRHNIGDYETAARRFQREIVLCQSLDNEHIVRVLDHGSTTGGCGEESQGDETLYYVMELLKGKSLDEYIERREKFSFYDVRQIMVQVLDGLAQAHDRKIVHRDMKPANISLFEDPPESHEFKVKVLDFGIAKVINGDKNNAQKITQTGAWMGSPAYMSPEHLKGCEVTPASDIFAVGLIMLEMLTGYQAIDGDSPMDVAMVILSQDPVYVEEWIAETSIGPIINKCVAKNPLERYANASELKEALLAIDDDTLKNEYAAAKLRKRSRTMSQSMQASGMVSQNAMSSQPTMSGEMIAEQRKTALVQNLLIIGIVLCVFAIGIFLFVKFYVDKAASEMDDIYAADQPIKFTPLQSMMFKSAAYGAAIGPLSLRRVEVAISSMPPGAKIYRSNDNTLIGETPMTISLIPLVNARWNLVVKADGFNDYPLVISPRSASNLALTMQPQMPPGFKPDALPVPAAPTQPAPETVNPEPPKPVDSPVNADSGNTKPDPSDTAKKTDSQKSDTSKKPASSKKTSSSKNSKSKKASDSWKIDDIL